MSKPKLLMDIDGVLADFFFGIATFLNTTYGTKLDPAVEPSAYDFEDWGGGVENLVFDQVIKRWIQSNGYFNIPIYPGAKEFFKEVDKNFEVSVVTARMDDAFGLNSLLHKKVNEDTEKWFKQHGLKVNLFYSQYKVDFCRSRGIHIMVEDKLGTAIGGAKQKIDTILMNRNWNQSPARLRVHRAYNYDEAISALNKLKQR